MTELGVLVVPFVLGRVFNVAEIQVLLRQALTHAMRALGGGLASPDPFLGAAQVLLRQALILALRTYPSFLALPDAEKNRRDYLGPNERVQPAGPGSGHSERDQGWLVSCDVACSLPQFCLDGDIVWP